MEKPQRCQSSNDDDQDDCQEHSHGCRQRREKKGPCQHVERERNWKTAQGKLGVEPLIPQRLSQAASKQLSTLELCHISRLLLFLKLTCSWRDAFGKPYFAVFSHVAAGTPGSEKRMLTSCGLPRLPQLFTSTSSGRERFDQANYMQNSQCVLRDFWLLCQGMMRRKNGNLALKFTFSGVAVIPTGSSSKPSGVTSTPWNSSFKNKTGSHDGVSSSDTYSLNTSKDLHLSCSMIELSQHFLFFQIFSLVSAHHKCLG